MAIKCVSAKYGNDNNTGDVSYDSNGNIDFKNAYLTIDKGNIGAGSYGTIYVGEGKYLVQNTSVTATIYIGIGNVVFEGLVFNTLSLIYCNYFNIKILNYKILSTSIHPFQVNIYNSCFLYNTSLPSLGYILNKSILNTDYSFVITPTSNPTLFSESSIYGNGNIKISPNVYNTFDVNNSLHTIWHTMGLELMHPVLCTIKLWDFYSVPITLGGITRIYDNSIPGINDIDGLRAAAVTAFNGVASDYFPECRIFDAATTPCFVAPTLGVKEGFYLDPLSPSATGNYITGKHKGALPVARGLIFPTGYTYGTNINASGQLIDANNNTPADNTIEYTNVFDHGKVILVENWGDGTINAERNGDIDSLDKDTADTTIGNGGTLTNSEVYVCEIESLSITDGTTTKNYAVGENCTVPATGTWTVVATLGVMRNLFTSKRQTIFEKFSKTDNTLTLNTYGVNADGYLRFYRQAYNGITAMPTMCHVDINGVPVLGDADAGFVYTAHATYGLPIRVQMRYEKKKIIIQTANAKS